MAGSALRDRRREPGDVDDAVVHRAAAGVPRRGLGKVIEQGLIAAHPSGDPHDPGRSEEHTSELQSLMRISYAVFCLQKKNTNTIYRIKHTYIYNTNPHNNNR